MKRALGGALLLAAEYLVLGVFFDGSVFAGRSAWWSAFAQVGAFVSISVAVLTAGFLIRGRELVARLEQSAAERQALEPSWAIAHALSFAGFVLVTRWLFGSREAASASMAAGAAGWLTLGALCLVTLFRVVFGRGWRPVATALFALLGAGLALGLLAWLAGVRSELLWPRLAGATLRTSALLLSLFVDDVRVVPSEKLLGIEHFEVTIATPCSGLEGLGAVLVFMFGYLFIFRERLRFPQSLLLVPVALLAVWVLNAVRIAVLVAIGAYVSPELALGTFHSKAGWLALCLVALGVVVTTQKSARFTRDAPDAPLTESPTAAFLLPLLTFAAVGLVTGLFAARADWLYPLRVVAAGAVAWHYRKEYPKPEWRVPWWGIAAGAVAFVLWIVLAKGPDVEGLAGENERLGHAAGWLRGAWLGFRVLGAVAVVPVIEELAFRGFLQRRLIGEDFTTVSQARFTWPSLVVSALAFGLLHESWLASTLAGALYSLACYRGGRLEDAVAAHATTNGLLVFGSLVVGYRHLWQ